MRIRMTLSLGLCLALAAGIVTDDALAKKKKKNQKSFNVDELCDRQYASGLEFKKNSRLIDAKDAFTGVIEACPAYFKAYLQLGNIAIQLQDYEGAMGYYEEAIALEPGDMDVKEALAYAYTATERLDEAEEIYVALLEADPERIGAMQNLAFNYEKQDKKAEAVMLYTQAMTVDNSLAGGIEGKLTRQYLDSKIYPQAMIFMSKEKDRNPTNLDLDRKIAYFYYKMQDWEDAALKYEELMAKETDPANLLNEHKIHAFVEKKAGHPEEALADYEYIVEHESEKMDNFYHFGNTALDAGDLDLAESVAKRGLARDSSWGCLNYLLGEITEKRAISLQDAKAFDSARDKLKQAKVYFQKAVGDEQCGDNAAKQLDRQDQLIDRLGKIQAKEEQSE